MFISVNVPCYLHRMVWVSVRIFILYSLCLGSAELWANTNEDRQTCTKLYRLKSYETAGKCFLKLSAAIGSSSRIKSAKKAEKGRYLRNAAISFEYDVQADFPF